ncbi:MAG: V-type ATP synthase subunit I [Clostridiales bacterium]|nr:V-type ATP synthase subunit I [Clostridiales bacterium]
MAIEKMQKVLIGGLREDLPSLSRRLQSLSILHMAQIQEAEGLAGAQTSDGEARRKLERIEAAMGFLKNYHAAKRGMLTAKPEMTPEEILDYDDEAVFSAADEAMALEQQLNSLRSEILQRQNAVAALAPYAKMDIRLDAVCDTPYTLMRLGTVPVDALEELKERIEPFSHLEVFGEKDDAAALLIVAYRKEEEELRLALRQAGYSEASLYGKGLVSDEIAALNGKISDLEARREAAGAKALELALAVMPKMQIAFDKYSLLTARDEAGEMARGTAKAFLMTGWIRKKDGEKLRKELFAVCPDLMIEDVEPDEGEVPPTAIVNSKLLKPFEAVTDMYSVPAHNGLDPTFLMAPFFFAFFGMMVSDAGYGMLLALGALFFLKKVRPKGMMGAITVVVGLGGISTLIWGALFGGWFGEELLPALWFIPMDEPIMMIVVCLAFGVVHISVGLLAKAFMLIRDGHPLDAIFDCGFLLCILWGLPLMVLGLDFMMYVALLGVVGILLTAGRDRQGILKKIMGGFSGLYGLMNYVSDILSYTRLFGLGLATGVIGMVFNTIGTMLMGSPIGIVFGIAVLIVGHGFNLAINALGAYVHSCRLQYIEFYSKFFEGNGRAFVPYGYRTKYVQLKY